MKPKPLVSLNHFTVPLDRTCSIGSTGRTGKTNTRRDGNPRAALASRTRAALGWESLSAYLLIYLFWCSRIIFEAQFTHLIIDLKIYSSKNSDFLIYLLNALSLCYTVVSIIFSQLFFFFFEGGARMFVTVKIQRLIFCISFASERI